VYLQSIPGSAFDRLWVSIGKDVVCIPVDVRANRKPKTATVFFPYWYSATVTDAWKHANLQDMEKLFLELGIFYDNAVFTTSLRRWIEVDYRTDLNTNWTTITEPVLGYRVQWYRNTQEPSDTTPSKTYPISPTYNLSGRRIQLRYRLMTEDNNETPKIIASVMELITRLNYKEILTFTFRIADKDNDLLGNPVPDSAADQVQLLEGFAASPLPVDVDSITTSLDGRKLLINPGTLRLVNVIPKEAGRELMIYQITAIGVP
jgi:hypothetical protein